MSGGSLTATLERERIYTAYGAAADLLFDRRDPEIVLSGPAGTGKSRGALEYVHKTLLEYPKVRALIVRKTLTSLTATGLVTYREKVLHPLDRVKFFGGNKEEPAQYRYSNGSRLVVGGLDKPEKVMSSDYDLVYVMECTELSENDLEMLTTRLRNYVLPWQQLIADCNPGPPKHWLRQRANRGQIVMLESRHRDNPMLFREGDWTPEGRTYLARLDNLTGVRRKRLRDGIWAAAEGMVYAEEWDPDLHLIQRFPIPPEWTRYWVVDFGYTHPFVWCEFAEDPDGRLYRTREIHLTNRLVEDHARTILAVTGWTLEPPYDPQYPHRPRRLVPARKDPDPLPRALICDHDAEDRATLERYLGVPTYAAYKAVSVGIQCVQARLRPAGDGKPRLLYLRDSLVEVDSWAVEHLRPTCTEDEYESYVWDTANGLPKGEQPVKLDDDGMDVTRYMVATLDDPRPDVVQTTVIDEPVHISRF
jgi:hypothetical protein